MCCRSPLPSYLPFRDETGIPTVAPLCDESYCRQLVTVPILDLVFLELHPRERPIRRGRRVTDLSRQLLPTG